MQNIFYIGSYTQDKNEAGIHHCLLNEHTARLEIVGQTGGCISPSYLAEKGGKVYAANEYDSGASLSVFQTDHNGALTKFYDFETPGRAMCHLMLPPNAPLLFASNYTSGDMACIKLGENGEPLLVSDFISHKTDSGEQPHVHSVTLTPDGRHVIIADLGKGTLTVYRPDFTAGTLGKELQCVQMPQGSGPRLLAFHPTQSWMLALCELSSTLYALSWDEKNGSLEISGSYPTLAPDFTGESYAGHIAFSPSGEYVYVSNRGEETIAIFEVLQNRELLPLGGFGCGGSWPRHFTFSQCGNWLFVANQRSCGVAVFRRCSDTRWKHTHTLEVQNPSFILEVRI